MSYAVAAQSPRTDRECLDEWRRQPSAAALRPILERYLGLVYAAAFRRVGNADQASDVARAVFLVLARRARKLRKKTILAGWLFQVTAVACRKLPGKRRRSGGWNWFGLRRRSEAPADALLWPRVAPELDAALDRLSSTQRNALLLRGLLNYEWEHIAKVLGRSEPPSIKTVDRAFKKVAKRLDRCGVTVEPHVLAQLCASEGCAPLVGEGFIEDVLASIEGSLGKKPAFKLARRVLSTLAWTRWRRRVAIGAPCAFVCIGTAAGVAWYVDSLSGHSRLWAAFFFWSVRHEAKTVPGLGQPARPWRANGSFKPDMTTILRPSDLYRTTNIWLAHLKVSAREWRAMEPKHIGVLPHFFQPDGTVLLRNPEARRSGLAGVLGLEFEWAHADLQFGGRLFTNMAVRFKGNGTYVTSLYNWKRPFKADLHKFAHHQNLGGTHELNFHNLVDDRSYMSDALAYEFFRDAGVPAPRTAYAYLSVSVAGKWEQRPLGLYVVVESVGSGFAEEHFGSKNTPVFKPVTYELFEHMGDDWSAYAPIYDLKTRATPEQRQRVIDLARLVSTASEAEFATHMGEFLDLDEFARFLAGEVLLSSYDGILSDGQNFYVYLDPKSNKFGFIPWDLDLAWGGFFLIGTTHEREKASIWHPWVGRNRFLERVMAVEEFRRIYRGHLEDFTRRLFVRDRLYRRIDELAGLLREPVAAESDFRLAKFDVAVSDKPAAQTGRSDGADRPVHQLKSFIKNRAASVRKQLKGNSEGVILERRRNR
jgi:DNA-directed RNA polymerase specialized sigma24 family protein